MTTTELVYRHLVDHFMEGLGLLDHEEKVELLEMIQEGMMKFRTDTPEGELGINLLGLVEEYLEDNV